MLYYIIPPIIVVISIAALIIFLLKKVSAVPVEALEDSVPKKEKRLIDMEKASQVYLGFLEKIMRRFKTVSLKIHNLTDHWAHSIRNCRERRLRKNSSGVTTKSPYAEIFKKIKKTPEAPVAEKKINQSIHPMLSDKVVHPESKIGEKGQFEKILIDRIALNPRDIEAYERLGNYYQEQGNIEDAHECYKQALKLSPVNQRVKNNLNKLKLILKK